MAQPRAFIGRRAAAKNALAIFLYVTEDLPALLRGACHLLQGERDLSRRISAAKNPSARQRSFSHRDLFCLPLGAGAHVDRSDWA
jgi:hypothetical protein